MLVQSSPALATSVNASPSPRSGFHNFHYAPAPSPRQSPSWVSTALSRRQSGSSPATSIASPSFSRPKRYVDAATQYSPMQPFDYASGAMPARADAPARQDRDRQEPPPPAVSKPKSTVPRDEPSSAGSDAAPAVKPAAAKKIAGATATDASHPLSPSKRKNLDEPGGPSTALANTAQSPSTLSKRPKPEAGPPKELPQKYEHCAVEDMVILIAHMLGELIETNDSLALKSGGHLTRFHSRCVIPKVAKRIKTKN